MQCNGTINNLFRGILCYFEFPSPYLSLRIIEELLLELRGLVGQVREALPQGVLVVGGHWKVAGDR